MKRYCWTVGLSILVLVGLPRAAQADSWGGHSLELTISDAEVVVRTTIGNSQTIRGGQGLTDGYTNNTVTLKIKEVLKSPAELAKA